MNKQCSIILDLNKIQCNNTEQEQQQQCIQFQVLKCSQESGLNVSQIIKVLVKDLINKNNNQIGKQVKDKKAPLINFGKDKYVSKELGELGFYNNNFVIQTYPTSTMGLQLQIGIEKDTQIYSDSIYNIDQAPFFIQSKFVYPFSIINQQQSQESNILSPLVSEFETTKTISEFQSQIQDVSQAQLDLIFLYPKQQKQKIQTLKSKSLEKDASFYIQSFEEEKDMENILQRQQTGVQIEENDKKQQIIQVKYHSKYQCWTIKACKTDINVFTSFSTYHQKSKGLKSSLFYLKNDMVLGCGQGNSNLIKVKI